VVLWVMTSHSDVMGYQRFGGLEVCFMLVFNIKPDTGNCVMFSKYQKKLQPLRIKLTKMLL